MTRSVRNAVAPLVLTLLSSALVHAAAITGIVTNKTNGMPSSGDNVTLVDVQAGMADAASAVTDRRGRYSLDSPGIGPYLIRVSHQGAAYFIAAPQGGATADVAVYDVAAKVDGVAIDADMLLVEAAGGMLRIDERYLVRNTSLPPRAQFSSNTFEVALPAGAELDGAAATRPGGLATNTRLTPLSQSGHYTFNTPIQPDQGEKETMFEVQYHLSYRGKYTFTPNLQMSTDNLVVYVPKSITFTAGQGAAFQNSQEDPRVQTFVAKGIHPGQAIGFSISGEGQMPREAQGAPMGQQAGSAISDSSSVGNRPGGGLGVPIGTPDPLSSYKWWILSSMTLLLVVGAGYMLRNRPAVVGGAHLDVPDSLQEHHPAPTPVRNPVPSDAGRKVAHVILDVSEHSNHSGFLLKVLKDELFAIESERLTGALSEEEYAKIKLGLEALLKRALKTK